MSSTNPPAPIPMSERPWIELAGAEALDPAQAARVERWLAEMFGDEDDSATPRH